MFNTYSNNKYNQNLEFHSVSGLICKSHPKSIICKTGKNPYLLDMDKPRTYRYRTYDNDLNYKEVVVLQAMLCEDGFIVEYMPKDVYEEEILKVCGCKDE